MVQHVTQFPSDQDLDRYIATIVTTENVIKNVSVVYWVFQEILTKCTECRGEIVCAKDKQSIEAAKAAEALLQMLEAEVNYLFETSLNRSI